MAHPRRGKAFISTFVDRLGSPVETTVGRSAASRMLRMMRAPPMPPAAWMRLVGRRDQGQPHVVSARHALHGGVSRRDAFDGPQRDVHSRHRCHPWQANESTGRSLPRVEDSHEEVHHRVARQDGDQASAFEPESFRNAMAFSEFVDDE